MKNKITCLMMTICCLSSVQVFGSQEDLSGPEEFYTRILDQTGSHADPFAELDRKIPLLDVEYDLPIAESKVQSRLACAVLTANALQKRRRASVAKRDKRKYGNPFAELDRQNPLLVEGIPGLQDARQKHLEFKKECAELQRQVTASFAQLSLDSQPELFDCAQMDRQYNLFDSTKPVVRSRFVQQLMQAQAYDASLQEENDPLNQSFDDLESLLSAEQSFFHVPVATTLDEQGSDLCFADQGHGFHEMNQFGRAEEQQQSSLTLHRFHEMRSVVQHEVLVPESARNVNIPRLRLVQHLAQAPIDVEEPELARCFLPGHVALEDVSAYVSPVPSSHEQELGYQAENDSPLLPMSQD